MLKGSYETEEHKRKISMALKGEKHPLWGKLLSKGTKLKISLARKGKTHSRETKKKMSEAKKGEKHPMYGKLLREETKMKISVAMIGKYGGENHPNWQGGISSLPYCYLFNDAFKKEIREKFNNICFICEVQPNHWSLPVHHIHYDRQAGCNGMGLECVPLCVSHNSKANYYREWWVAYFENRLWNIFGWHIDLIQD